MSKVSPKLLCVVLGVLLSLLAVQIAVTALRRERRSAQTTREGVTEAEAYLDKLRTIDSPRDQITTEGKAVVESRYPIAPNGEIVFLPESKSVASVTEAKGVFVEYLVGHSMHGERYEW